MNKRTQKSIANILNKFNLDYKIEDFYELYDIDKTQYLAFLKKYFTYREKYCDSPVRSDIEEIIKTFKIYLNREVTSKITLNNFIILGLGEKEYRKYCKNKTHKMSFMPSVSANKEYLINKYGIEKAEEILKSRNTVSIEYFLKKTNGNMEKAKELQKERQTTFSLKKCIAKYGEEKGLEVFNERQRKWQETLNNKSQEEIDDINRRRNPMIKKENENIDEYFKRVYNSINERENRRENINSAEDYISFKVREYQKPLTLSHIKPEDYYDNSGVILKTIINKEDFLPLINDYYKPNKFYKSKMGCMTKVEEALLRSYQEYRLYKILKELGYEFTLGKKYPEINMYSDFYLVKYNVHIEVAGLMIHEDYRTKMKFKEKHFNSIILTPDKIEDFSENYPPKILDQIGKLPHLLEF